MKKFLSVNELDRTVKFLHDLNELAHKHKIGLSSYEDIRLTMDDQDTPFILDASGSPHGDDLQLLVSL